MTCDEAAQAIREGIEKDHALVDTKIYDTAYISDWDGGKLWFQTYAVASESLEHLVPFLINATFGKAVKEQGQPMVNIDEPSAMAWRMLPWVRHDDDGLYRGGFRMVAWPMNPPKEDPFMKVA
jgi:hypothetical protein